MDLENKLQKLVEMGCHPALSWRSGVWRVHINACGNFWDESAVSPLQALLRAKANWEEAGCPKDGYADVLFGLERFK